MYQIPQIPLTMNSIHSSPKPKESSLPNKQVITCTDIQNTDKCDCTLINDELCGNIYFPINTMGQEKLSIFNIPRNMGIQGHVTFFNHEESAPFIVELIEFNAHPKSLRILPGNTQGMFFNNLKSICVLNSNCANAKIEGKYCLRINYYNCCSCSSHTHSSHSCSSHSCSSHSCSSHSCGSHSCGGHSCGSHSCSSHSCNDDSYHSHSYNRCSCGNCY